MCDSGHSRQDSMDPGNLETRVSYPKREIITWTTNGQEVAFIEDLSGTYLFHHIDDNGNVQMNNEADRNVITYHVMQQVQIHNSFGSTGKLGVIQLNITLNNYS